MDLPSLDSLNYTLALLGVAAIALGIWRSKARRRANAAYDAILGQEAVTDNSGNILSPAQPGLVHRVATLETTAQQQANILKLLADTRNRLDVHDAAINALIAGSLERAATAMSSAALLHAVANRDLLDEED